MEVAASARNEMQVGDGAREVETEDRHLLRKVRFRGRSVGSPAAATGNANTECPECVAHQQQREGLRRIGHFLSATIDALAAHIVVLDSAGVIVAANAAWRRFAKDNQGNEQTCGVGANYLAVCQVAAEKGVTEASAVALGIRQVLAGQQKEFSLTYACPGVTEEWWFTVRISGFENDGDAWAVVTHEDVTALQKKEQALRQREEWFRALSTLSPIGIFQTNATGQYIYTNPRWQEIYGLTFAESLGKGWSQTLHPKDRPHVHTTWEEAIRNGTPFHGEFRIITPAKVTLWIRVHAKPMPGNDGATIGHVGTVEDITASRRAEEALHQSEERWQLAFQGTNDGIWDWKVHSNDFFLSPHFKAAFGYTEQRSHNRFDFWLELIHPQDAERVMQAVRDHMARLTPGLESEHRMRCKDGSYRWVLVRGQALRDEAGFAVRMVGSVSDITARKQIEEEKATFARIVLESNHELQEFASVASHDLQEPLRKIQAFGELLQKSHRSELSEDGRDYLQRMLNAAERMRTLINDLLALSRVTTKARPMVSIDLTQVVREVVVDLEIRVTQSGGRVEVGTLPLIDADPLQMRQLFQNLIGNALKFRKPGVAPVVKVTAIAENSWCEIRVEDNGIGFDTKYLSRIFAPFQRLHARQQYEGSGMGLAICRKIIERHKGRITATSVPEQGATFVITLPVKQGESGKVE